MDCFLCCSETEQEAVWSSRSELLDTSGLGTVQRSSLQAPRGFGADVFRTLEASHMEFDLHTPFKGNEAEETREGPKNVVYSRIKRTDSQKSHHSFHHPTLLGAGKDGLGWE